jgi:low temperature requirement protein LtrA
MVICFTFLIIQLGRTCWAIVYSPNAIFRDNFWRVLIWQIASAPFWIVGACVSNKIRILLWLAAGGIDLLGTWLAHPFPSRRFFSEDVEFDAAHLGERCRLFRLIAIAEANLNYMTVVLGILAMAEIVYLWHYHLDVFLGWSEIT